MLGLGVRQERVGGQVQQWETGTTEGISSGPDRGENQHHVVVGRVHTVEVCKVQADIGIEQVPRWDLETQGSVRGVPGGEACVELCVAAEEDSL